jgi:Arc/MetJ family transcription regulator
VSSGPPSDQPCGAFTVDRYLHAVCSSGIIMPRYLILNKFYYRLALYIINVYISTKAYTRKLIMRTNIVIDDKLMAEAIKLSQLKTKKAVVETGLRLLIQIKKQERIKGLRGKLNWDGDLEKMRLDQ